MESEQRQTNAHGEIKYFSQSKIGTYGKENSYFWPDVIRRYLTYVYDSTFFLASFSTKGNIQI